MLEKKGQKWHLAKYLGIAGNYLLMMFYTTISGWMLIYFIKYADGSILAYKSAEELGAVFGTMISNPVLMVCATFAVILVCFSICSFGLQKGVERITKWMMVALLLLMVGLAIYSCTLSNAAEGLKFYLVPSLKSLENSGVWTVISSAMGQAFFTLSIGIGGFIDSFQHVLYGIPFYITIAVLAILAWMKSGKGTAVFTVLGLLLIYGMGFWEETMQTLALVLSSTCLALLLGVPLGIWTANSNRCNKIMRPILDFMQTMPAFVYLIPAVLFFGLGTVPGAFATVIFAMPPVVRLTGLGIRQVPKNVVEASRSFGATPWQLLYKVQLPLALPTIMTGINQTIMMSLSMVVIAAMISAGGLGEVVLKGITQMKIGLGFEGGIAVVILAIVLDRITQGMAQGKKKKQ